MRYPTLAKLIIALLLSIVSCASLAASISWHRYSEAAFSLAKKENRLVLLFGKAAWCPWCRRMQNEVFTNGTVIGLINKYYIPVVVDIDNDAAIADSYHISGVPANIIMNSDYKIIDSKMGFVDANEMASFLRSNASN